MLKQPLSDHTDPISGFLYVASYRRADGKTHTVDIWAHSLEEAQANVWALKQSLTLDGQVFMRDDIEGGVA
jgi:hypothetical protein